MTLLPAAGVRLWAASAADRAFDAATNAFHDTFYERAEAGFSNFCKAFPTSPRLAEVTPIRPSLPDVSLIPFKPGFGLTGHRTFTEVLSLGEVDVDTSTKA